MAVLEAIYTLLPDVAIPSKLPVIEVILAVLPVNVDPVKLTEPDMVIS